MSAEHLESPHEPGVASVPGVMSRRRTVFAALSIVLGALGAAWSGVVTALVFESARVTYYLPAPDSTVATEHHDWHLPSLLLTPLGALALHLAALALARGGWGLVRRRGVRGWVLVLPCLALALATAVLALAAGMSQDTY